MMRGAGKSDRPVVPEEPANEDENCLGRRGSGEACTGTSAETPETGKCKPDATPDATPGGSNRAAEQVTELAPPARRFERAGATDSRGDCGGGEGDGVRGAAPAAISRCG